MAYTVARHTDAGRMRSRNEDASLCLRWEQTGYGATAPILVAAVADGMGGHANGHLAAALAVRTLATELTARLGALPLDAPPGAETLVALLHEAVLRCAERVNTASAGGGEPMGCTLAVALFWMDRLLVANVGDSRVYLRHQRLQQITEDHSVEHHQIYRVIGFGRPAQPDYFSLHVQAGDTVLLCSDGLPAMVPDAEIDAVLSRNALLTERCRQLVDRANAAGGADNVTVLAVQVESIPAAASPTTSV